MSNLSYQDDASTLWNSREVVRFFKNEVILLRDKHYRTLEDKIQLAETLKEYFVSVGVENAALISLQSDKGLAPEQFLQAVLNGIKPLVKSKKIGNPKGKKEGAVILAFLSDQHPEIAKKVLDFAASETKRVGRPKLVIKYRLFANLDEELTDRPSIPIPDELKSKEPIEENSDDNPSSYDSASVINNDWHSEHIIAPRVLPMPKPEELWDIVSRVGLPRSLDSLSYTRYGFSTFHITAAIWTKDNIRILALDKKMGMQVRLFTMHLGSTEAWRLFKKMNNKHFSGPLRLKSIEAGSDKFIMADAWGISIIEPDRDRSYYNFESYGNFTYLSPKLLSHSGNIEKSSNLPVDVHLSEIENGYTYSAHQNGLAVSKSGKIIHSTYVVTSDDVLGEVGEKIILWTPQDFNHSEYKGEIIHTPIKIYLNRVNWSPSENFVAFNGEHMLCLETSSMFKIETPEETVEDGWHPKSTGTHPPKWHPSSDIFVTTGYKCLDESKYLNRVEIWDATRRKMIGAKSLGKTDYITSIDWSPDGSKIVFTHSDFTVTIWDLETDKTNDVFIDEAKLLTLRFSPDGQRIAMQSMNEKNENKKVFILGSDSAQILTSFSGCIDIFKETPWHYEGRDIAYKHEKNICVRRLQF